MKGVPLTLVPPPSALGYRERVPPSVLRLSTYDANGGAARAAYALHRAMVDSWCAFRDAHRFAHQRRPHS